MNQLIKNCLFFLVLLLTIHSCGGQEEDYRPDYHFTPPSGWINGPSGLVYYENEYHLFYQYYPDNIQWGSMHWGHAISEDLVNWSHLPIALYPDSKLGMVFSGSIVVDKNNSSGFFEEDGEGLVAVFTHSNKQQQSIAYSQDNGRSWTQYSLNPVIINTPYDDISENFRNPKVFRHDDIEKWIMSIAAGDHIQFWSSADLKTWQKEGDFGLDQGSHDGLWESPDLIQLPVKGGQNQYIWALIVSVNLGSPAGGSGTQYFIGDFRREDGQLNFFSDQNDVKWLDFGSDNYAGLTWTNLPVESGKTLFIAWMNNWSYAGALPTQNWQGYMTMPRELYIIHEEEYFLASRPLEAMDSLADRLLLGRSKLTTGKKQFIGKDLESSRTRLTIGTEADFTLIFSNKVRNNIEIAYLQEGNILYMNRINSGNNRFSHRFFDIYMVEMEGRKQLLDLEIFLDRTSVEIFADDGKYVMTSLIFPDEPLSTIFLKTHSRVIDFETVDMKPFNRIKKL